MPAVWYYKSILSPIPVPTTSYSYTGSRGSKSQTNTIIISVPIRHWLGILSVNTSCNGSPDLTPLYSCLRAACKKLMQQDLAIVFRYSYRSIGQTYSCLGGQTRGVKHNPSDLNSLSWWFKERCVLILDQNRSKPLVPVHRTGDLFTMNTLYVSNRPNSADRVSRPCQQTWNRTAVKISLHNPWT